MTNESDGPVDGSTNTAMDDTRGDASIDNTNSSNSDAVIDNANPSNYDEMSSTVSPDQVVDYISGLPTELKYEITDHFEDKTEFSQLYLTSKIWKDFVKPLLFWRAVTLQAPMPYLDPMRSKEFLSALANDTCELVEKIRSVQLKDSYPPPDRKYWTRKELWDIWNMICAKNLLTTACLENARFNKTVELMNSQNRITHLQVRDARFAVGQDDANEGEVHKGKVEKGEINEDGTFNTPRFDRELAIVTMQFISQIFPDHSREWIGVAMLAIIAKSPSLQKISVDVTRHILDARGTLDNPCHLPQAFFDQLFGASRGTPITVLRLKGVDLSAFQDCNLASLSFLALKTLHVEQCSSYVLLLNTISDMHDLLREGLDQPRLETFCFVPAKGTKQPPGSAVRGCIARFLRSFSNLRQLSIVSCDEDFVPRFDLFKSHASTLESLLVEVAEANICYSLDDISSILENCPLLEHIGIPLPPRPEDSFGNTFHYENDEIPAYLKEIARFPKLYSFRITTFSDPPYLNTKLLAKSCLLDLINYGSNIQVCGVWSLEEYRGDEGRYHRMKSSNCPNFTTEDVVEQLSYQDLCKDTTSIFRDADPLDAELRGRFEI